VINAETQRHGGTEKKDKDGTKPTVFFGRRLATWLVVPVVIVGILFGGVRLWFVEGLLRRVVIDGPSMAPAFYGAHYELKCDDCGFPFLCDAEHVPSDGKAACPNCGFTENLLAEARLMPAERVMIDRWPLRFREPQKREIVAFEIPDSAGEIGVKRVAALPGERVAIRGGELFIDDVLVRKSVEDWRADRILVYDNGFQPQKTVGLPPRWGPCAFWRATERGFQFEITHNLVGPFFWFPLEYQHWSCTANSHLRGVPAVVRDNDSFNQGEVIRSLNEVRDVAVSFRVTCRPDATLILCARDGEEQFQVTLRENNAEFIDNREANWRLPVRADLSKGANVEFGLVDEQWFLVIDDKVVSWQSYQRPRRISPDGDPPQVRLPSVLTIAATHQPLEISDPKVWRDVYYLDPQGLSRDWQMGEPLNADEYFLLGDNQPVSVDSRHWPSGVSRTAIRGLVRKK
jgi:type IV secretory pathway protease TraF